MKLQNLTMVFILMLTASLLFGCSPKEIERKIDTIEDTVEQQIEQTENTAEGAVNPNGNAPYTANITAEEAQTIALTHAGFTLEQVTRLHTELELDDRIPHYDVQFYQDYWEYDYEINANTGDILSFEKDN